MKKILLILRPDGTREMLYKALFGRYELLVCDCAEEGAVLLAQRPDAVVVDLFLPGMDGLTFLENSTYHPPIVFALTELVTEGLMERCQKAGVSHLFLKPCISAMVYRKLEEALAESEKSPLP